MILLFLAPAHFRWSICTTHTAYAQHLPANKFMRQHINPVTVAATVVATNSVVVAVVTHAIRSWQLEANSLCEELPKKFPICWHRTS